MSNGKALRYMYQPSLDSRVSAGSALHLSAHLRQQQIAHWRVEARPASQHTFCLTGSVHVVDAAGCCSLMTCRTARAGRPVNLWLLESRLNTAGLVAECAPQ